MQNELVKTKNVAAFYGGLDRLRKGVRGVYGMMLLAGTEGTGKTYVGQHTAMGDDFVYVRCNYVDTPRSLLSAIVAELGEEPKGVSKTLFNQARQQLLSNARILFLDEVDYITNHKFVEVVRDLNDLTNVPIIMSGMGNIDRKLQAYPHLYDRIRVVCRFELFDLAEIRKLAKTLCSVELDETALNFIHEKGQGKYRLTNEFFELAEAVAKNSKLKIIEGSHLKQMWKKR